MSVVVCIFLPAGDRNVTLIGIPVDVKKALEAKDRSACGPVSPPHGLYLTDVVYEPNPFT